MYKWLEKLFIPKVKRVYSKPFVYVAIGDSTVEGLGASSIEKSYPYLIHSSIKNRFKRAKLYNLGRSGAITKTVLTTQVPEAIKLDPDLITISVGANDIFRMYKSKKFKGEYEQLLKTLSKKTEALIVINTIPDLAATPSVPLVLKPYYTMKIRNFNKIIKELAEEYGGIVVDIYAQSKTLTKNDAGLLWEDDLHPSDKGYKIWAEYMLDQMKDLLLPRNKKIQVA